MKVLIKDVWRLFRYYPLRSLLSLLSLVVGMGTLTALIVIENNIALHSQKMLDQQGARLGVSITKSDLHSAQVDSWVKHFEPEYQLVPYYSAPLDVTFKNKKLLAEVIAVNPDLFKAMRWKLQRGRNLHVLDANTKVIVIGAEVANLLQNQSAMELSIAGEYYNIIGILDKIDFDPILNFDPNYSVFLESSFIQHFNLHPVAQDFVAFVNSKSLMEAERLLRQKLTSQLPRSTIFIKNPVVLQKALYKHIELTLKTLRMISLITLLLGFISSLNLFLILLQERKSEMGLRLALGASMQDLGWQFFKETMLMCILGGGVGVILGQLGAIGIVHNLNIQYYWQFSALIVCLGISCGIGILVGIVPAIVAAKQSPIKLL